MARWARPIRLAQKTVRDQSPAQTIWRRWVSSRSAVPRSSNSAESPPRPRNLCQLLHAAQVRRACYALSSCWIAHNEAVPMCVSIEPFLPQMSATVLVRRVQWSNWGSP